MRALSRRLNSPPRARVAALGAVAALAVVGAGTPPSAAAQFTAKGPIGWESLRRLDTLPLFRSGVQTRQSSSYDRSGANLDGERGTCLRGGGEGNECVVAEHSGAGEIDSIWFTRDGGDVTLVGKIRIEVDGRGVVDTDYSDVVDGLNPPFVHPLVATANQSSGGTYVKVPIPFRSSMRVVVRGDPRYWHVTYRVFSNASGVPAFNDRDGVPDVFARLRAAGSRDPKPSFRGARTVRHAFTVAPGARASVPRITGGGAITSLQLRFGRVTPARADRRHPHISLWQSGRLQIGFDGRRTVDSPVGEFFGSGLMPAPVRALMFSQGPGAANPLTSWWPMPFRSTADVSFLNSSPNRVSGVLLVTRAPAPGLTSALASGRAGYFHTTSHRGNTVPGRNWNLLSARGRGVIVGVTQTMHGRAGHDYLEGDEQVFVDGSPTPQIQGTGTEDLYEGGYYFRNGTFSAPLTGNPVHVHADRACATEDCVGAYRLFLTDAIPFSRSVSFSIEHGNQNTQQALYGSTTYWYGGLGGAG